MFRRRNSPMHCLALLSFAGLPFKIHFDRPDPPLGEGGGGGGGTPPPPPSEIELARRELAARDAEIAEMQAKIADLSSKSMSDADRKALADLKAEKAEAEKKRLAEQGELQKLLDAANNELAETKRKLEEVTSNAKKREIDLRLSNFLEREIPKHTGVPSEQIIGALNLKSWFVYEEATGAFKILDPIAKTTPRNSNGGAMTPEEFVGKKIAETTWAATVKPLGGSGSHSQDRPGSGLDGEITSTDLAGMSIAEYKKNRAKVFAEADANTRYPTGGDSKPAKK